MNAKMNQYKVAAVHAAPVYLDLEKSVDKACRLIAEAAEGGAKLAAFPESYLPGYPYWIWTHTTREGGAFYFDLSKNAVEVPGEATDRLCEAARKAGIFVVMGMTEKEGYTLYNTQLYINDRGQIIGKHRKLQPTMSERVVWGRGDGSDLDVFDTEIGKISGLICWEHTMDLARYALETEGEQIHISAWPGISAVTNDPNCEIFNAVAEVACRHHALVAQAFVISTFTPVDEYTIERLGLTGRPEMITAGGGATSVFGPNGQFIAGPVSGVEDQILYADIDLDQIIYCKMACDSIGHYARPDVLQLRINRSKPTVAENIYHNPPFEEPAGTQTNEQGSPQNPA